MTQTKQPPENPGRFTLLESWRDGGSWPDIGNILTLVDHWFTVEIKVGHGLFVSTALFSFEIDPSY